MTADEVRSLVRLLHWSAPLNHQQMAIGKLSQLAPEHYPLLFDWRNKPRWKNTVKVIENIGFPQNQPLLVHLFCLLQDLNWPGAEDAVRVLAALDRAWLLPELERYTLLARRGQDRMWLGGLLALARAAGLAEADFSSPEYWKWLESSGIEAKQ